VSIGLLVEGKSDVKALSELARRVLQQTNDLQTIVIRKFGGHGDLFNARKVTAVVREMLAKHPDLHKVTAIVDSDCVPARADRIKAVEAALEGTDPKPQYCLALQALEGWLIADSHAVSQVLGKDVSFGHPENECQPDELLRRTFRRYGKHFVKDVENLKIARSLNLAVAKQRNSSFNHFCQLIEDS